VETASNAATKSLAIEYAKKGIGVNAVAPGNIKTPMRGPGNHKALSAFQPIGRMGETSDIATPFWFLTLHRASPERFRTSMVGKAPAAEIRHHLGGKR
jgi:NAD(P)-dependent dehydrogenase (short-subunit alcohol dehydrogenase family)